MMHYLVLIDRGLSRPSYTILIAGPKGRGHLSEEAIIEQAKLHDGREAEEYIFLASFTELTHINHDYMTLYHWQSVDTCVSCRRGRAPAEPTWPTNHCPECVVGDHI